MTNEEAIKWLNLEIEIWEAECKSLHPTKDALRVAIEALEKQIPKKPIARKHDELRGHILFHCPACDDDFNCNEYEETYCAECGQRLNWREVE